MHRLILVSFLWCIWPFLSAEAEVFRVVNTADTGEGSFRSALAKANNATDASEIIFQIPLTDKRYEVEGNAWRIFVETPLPELNALHPVKISGKNIVLDGSLSRSRFSGLVIKTSGHTLKNFTIQKFGEHGIWVLGEDEREVSDILIQNNHISDNGTFDQNGKYGDGIRFTTNVNLSEISDNTLARNIGNGIFLESLTTNVGENRIYRNLVSGNGKNGITIAGGKNVFGIDHNQRPAPNMVIQNKLHGYEILGRFARENQIAYDKIGISEDRKNLLGNGLDGIRIKLGAKRNILGPSLYIADNDGGIVIMGENSVQNEIIENTIEKNQTSGILLEKIKSDADILTKISKSQIRENGRTGIRLHGASALISENHIQKNQNYGVELLVHDDGTPNILEDSDEFYSNPTLKENLISENSLGGIYALDTIFHDWETVEIDNQLRNNQNFDVLVDWFQLFEVTPDSDDFAYLQAEISACDVGGKPCRGSEIREAYGKYYLGPDKFFNPKNRETFFKIAHFKVVEKERTNFSPHSIQLTGAVERKIMLNDRGKAEKNLKNLLTQDDEDFHTSAPKIIDDAYAGNNFERVHATFFSLGTIRQEKHGVNWFWTVFSGMFTLLALHFYRAGRRLQQERAQKARSKIR
jgi:hypothetical protein